MTPQIPTLSGFMPRGGKLRDNIPHVATELVKGAGMSAGYGPNPKPMKAKEADQRGKSLRDEVYKAVSRSTNKNRLPEVIKGLDGTSMGSFLRYAQMSPQQAAQTDMIALLQDLARSIGNPELIAKSISLASPLTSGFVPFDLRARAIS